MIPSSILIEFSRRYYGNKALALVGCRQEGLALDSCEQDVFVFPARGKVHVLEYGNKVYEFIPIEETYRILLESKTIQPIYDPQMLLHSALKGDIKLAKKRAIINEIEEGFRDLISSLYYEPPPFFLVRASLRLARALLISKNVVPRPAHLFHLLREYAPSILYRFEELWRLELSPMEKLNLSILENFLDRNTLSIAEKKLSDLKSRKEHIQAKLFFYHLFLNVKLEERDLYVDSRSLCLTKVDKPEKVRETIKEGYKSLLISL